MDAPSPFIPERREQDVTVEDKCSQGPYGPLLHPSIHPTPNPRQKARLSDPLGQILLGEKCFGLLFPESQHFHKALRDQDG